MAKKAALRLADLKKSEQPSLPGTTQPQPDAATEQTTGQTQEQDDMAKKPGMAGKKDWTFAIKHDQEIPAVTRTGRRLPFDFDGMKVGSMFTVPKEFWVEFSGLTDKQATDAARNKEAIRRSFYGWRDAASLPAPEAAKRKKLALAFSDQYDKTSKAYTGVNVYMAQAQAKAA